MLPLDGSASFDPQRPEEFFSALPARPAVFLIEPRKELTGARPVLLRTADLQRRLRLLLGPPDPTSKRVNLHEFAAGIRFRRTGSAFEQALALWQHARALWPSSYRQRLRLHAAPMIKLNLSNAYPRAYATRRVSPGGLYFGPFATRRAADAFLEPFQDLFRLRRCQIKIRRDPEFPGCIYSEMKMCLAPCFAGCSDADYAAEAARVVAFLGSRGASLSDELTRERETASAALDFERAAALHRRLEKIADVWRLAPDVAHCMDRLDAILLQRAAAENVIAVFVVRGGRIADPFLLHFDELASQPRSVEQMLRELIEPTTAPSALENAAAETIVPEKPASEKVSRDSSAAELEDHLALLARWFYARPREGEVFFAARGPAGWPYRRMLRACSRLLAPPAAPAQS